MRAARPQSQDVRVVVAVIPDDSLGVRDRVRFIAATTLTQEYFEGSIGGGGEANVVDLGFQPCHRQKCCLPCHSFFDEDRPDLTLDRRRGALPGGPFYSGV